MSVEGVDAFRKDLIKTHRRFSISGSFARERQLRLGGAVCLPSTCSTPRIQSFVNDFLQSADLHVTSDYDQSQWCATNEPKDLETIDIVCV